MPRFTPNLTGVAAGVPVLAKGSYEFAIGEMKPAVNNRQIDGVSVQQQVVRTSIKVISGESNLDKTLPHTLDMNNDFGAQFAKQFLMAALGYARNEEGRFNADFADDEKWAIDAETGELGEIYKEAQGKNIRAEVTTYIDKKDVSIERNNFKWLPF
jgi:hypothetical protein